MASSHRPVIVVSKHDPELARVAALRLQHYGVTARVQRRLPLGFEPVVVDLHCERNGAIRSEGTDIVLRRWSAEDLAHGVDIALGRVADGVHLGVGRLTMVGPESQVWLDDRLVSLTRTEQRLVRHLLRRPQVPHDRHHLLTHVWPVVFNGRENVVDTYVSYVRRKLRDQLRLTVRTQYGTGYSIYPP
jgi:two-component system, OmpR family, response regulator